MNQSNEALVQSLCAIAECHSPISETREQLENSIRYALSHRPEGEAVAWQFFQDGRWYEGKAGHNRENMSANGLPVRDLYVAPPDTVPLSELEKAKADCDRYMFAAMHCKVILPDGNTCHSKEQFDKAMQEHQT